MSPPDLISVVITTYNRSDALHCVVQSLARQTDRQLEIIVADDGSRPDHRRATERSLETVAQEGIACTHVWHPDVGFTAARVRNLGVRAARGNYVVLLDGDCVAEVDFIDQHRRLRQPGCFVNGSRVMLSATMTDAVLQGLDVQRHGHLWWWRRWRQGQASKWTARWRLAGWKGLRRQPAFVWKGIRSCNMGVWMQDYQRVNGFDSSFVGWGHEDADFVLRMHHAGLQRINGFLATEVYHLWHRESSRDEESRNALRVRERMQTSVVEAEIGLRECAGDSTVQIRRWG